MIPYSVVKRGDVWVVQKADGSRVFGRHDSEEKARKQQAALYANEKR